MTVVSDLGEFFGRHTANLICYFGKFFCGKIVTVVINCTEVKLKVDKIK